MSVLSEFEQHLRKALEECARLREENDRLRALLCGQELPRKGPIQQSSPVAGPDSGAITNASSPGTKLALFRRLFRGREDVYAVRWESKDGKSGYSPAGIVDWKAIRAVKPAERKKVARETRSLLPLTDDAVRDHLLGNETFLAGCYEKAEEIDDSSGGFGQFVEELFCGWIKARQMAGADSDETATRLLAWMDDDPYGFCYHLEKDAARVFDKAGLAAFEKQIRARFDAAATGKPAPGEAFRRNPDYQRRRSSEMLRAIYIKRKSVDAYIALTEATELTAQDCHALATMLVARRKPEEALSWVERGLLADKKNPHGYMAAHNLARLKRDLLTKLDRRDEALEAAWAEYRADPSKYSYGDLMKYVPKAERAAWHKKALDAAKGADLDSLIELFLETKELERLADLVRRTKDATLEEVSHYATEPAAKKLEKAHPELAARLWCAQGMRVVKGKKSKYYDAAISNFERARRCFEKAGRAADWQRVVEKVRSEHHRKTGFMPGFEEVVAGSGPSDKPSFLERAKAHWGERK